MSAMKTSLTSKAASRAFAKLRRANAAFEKIRPGDSAERQPVHVVYGGAHLFQADSAPKLGSLARAALAEYAPDAASLAAALGIPDGGLAETVYCRVSEKLGREPVEDFRIDFEDGFGNRPDEEEDLHARRVAEETAKGLSQGTLPPFIGIRIKPLSRALHRRSIRTLDLFLTRLAAATQGRLPNRFVVTLPKITSPAHVSALADLLDALEKRLKLGKGSVRIELMIETPQSVLEETGGAAGPALLKAGRGRVAAAHFGTYDYTALCNITARHQTMTHPSCDFAKHVTQVSLAQTGAQLSDGATNVMPVPVHRPEPGGTLSPERLEENRRAVHGAWRLQFEHIRHSLVTGYYQGWDLHPAQLPVRYAALYSFFLEGLEEASGRLKSFVEKAAQATLLGGVFDDAATGQGLLNFFLRGLNCGAITLEEARATGLTREEIRGRSFVRILENRRKSLKLRGLESDMT